MSSLMDDLQDPGRFPDPTKKISLVQTHISIVFVADEFVYKIKKPVDFGFLDFSSLEKRRYYCRREVELNSRLSENIYMEVLPVVFDGESHSLGPGGGETVEYAVKMRRIPDEKLMKSVFYRGELTGNHLRRIAEKLADFHRSAERNQEIDQFGEPDRFKVNTDENFEQVEKYMGITIREEAYRDLKNWTDDFFKSNKGLFLERIKNGRIRDCHGDLHMEHICFTEPMSIIDCIEFNDRFRYSDSLADIAFLLMDLEYNGGPEFSGALWNEYKRAADEETVDDLMRFYKVYRAFVRGKVNSFQLDDEGISPEGKAEATKVASEYFNLAYSYIQI